MATQASLLIEKFLNFGYMRNKEYWIGDYKIVQDSEYIRSLMYCNKKQASIDIAGNIICYGYGLIHCELRKYIDREFIKIHEDNNIKVYKRIPKLFMQQDETSIFGVKEEVDSLELSHIIGADYEDVYSNIHWDIILSRRYVC